MNDTNTFGGFMGAFLACFRDEYLKLPSFTVPLMSGALSLQSAGYDVRTTNCPLFHTADATSAISGQDNQEADQRGLLFAYTQRVLVHECSHTRPDGLAKFNVGRFLAIPCPYFASFFRIILRFCIVGEHISSIGRPLRPC